MKKRLTQHGIMSIITPISQWPELQMRKIRQKFMLTRHWLPKENCLVFMCSAAISESPVFNGLSEESKIYQNAVFYQRAAFFKDSSKYRCSHNILSVLLNN